MTDPLPAAIPSGQLATPKDAVVFVGLICAEGSPTPELAPLVAALTTVALQAELDMDNAQRFVRRVRDRWTELSNADETKSTNQEEKGKELGRAIAEELQAALPPGRDMQQILEEAFPTYQLIMDVYTGQSSRQV